MIYDSSKTFFQFILFWQKVKNSNFLQNLKYCKLKYDNSIIIEDIMEAQSKPKQRSKTFVKLAKVLQAAHKGFAYEMMELEMSIDDPNTLLGPSKIDDITHLVQLYMLGVEVLEGCKDKNYDFFKDKLQQLMKKRIVLQELKLDISQVIVENKSARTKRITHLQQINKKTEEHSIQKLTEIVNNASGNVQSCKGIIEGDIKKQQDKIKERIASRSKTKGSQLNISLEKKVRVPGKSKNRDNIQNQYYAGTVKTNKSIKNNKSKDPRSTTRSRQQSRENRFDINRAWK